jgi:hypothetical protein
MLVLGPLVVLDPSAGVPLASLVIATAALMVAAHWLLGQFK